MKGEFEERIRKHCAFPTSVKFSTVDTIEEATEEEIQKLMQIVVDAQKEFHSIIYVKEPLDWLHHTGEIKQKLEAFDKKWFGDGKK